MAVDVSRLNEGERALLALLAAGHTAKSAAIRLGVTETAVNERLRSARRKTGMGSSRELARLVAAADRRQENGDNFSGLVEPAKSAQPRPDPPVGGQARDRGVGPMIATLGGGLTLWAVAALTANLSPAPVGPPKVIETYPAANATIPTGPITLRVTFDRPMRPGSYSFVKTDAGRYPDCSTQPRQTPDARSFTLTCRIQEPGRYAIGFNVGRFRNFVDKETGLAAEPAIVRFTAKP